MAGFEHEDLVIEVADGDGTVMRLDWKGKSNAREPWKVLAPFFEQVLDAATTRKHTVEMHFEGIDHFNSSTITAIIQLIQRARKIERPLVIVFDPGLKWQKLSFDALKVFQKPDGLLSIREVN